ncbi:MAG: hypothetical protein KBB55_02250 [Candidatus Buchananbacteria bacterium]|nr:hypothetical protein [Candidatus Buchananbacteria bacterium]
MILVIDNISDSLRVSLLRAGQEIGSLVIEGQRADLLAEVSKLLTKNKTKIKALKGIAVVAGPGRFSAVRRSVAIANALAFAQQIPVVGISQAEANDLEQLSEKLKSAKVGVSIVPLYDGEPNITVDKSLAKKS